MAAFCSKVVKGLRAPRAAPLTRSNVLRVPRKAGPTRFIRMVLGAERMEAVKRLAMEVRRYLPGVGTVKASCKNWACLRGSPPVMPQRSNQSLTPCGVVGRVGISPGPGLGLI